MSEQGTAPPDSIAPIRSEYLQGKKGRWRWLDRQDGRTVAIGPVYGYDTEQEAKDARHRYLQDASNPLVRKLHLVETGADELRRRLQKARDVAHQEGESLRQEMSRWIKLAAKNRVLAWCLLGAGVVGGAGVTELIRFLL